MDHKKEFISVIGFNSKSSGNTISSYGRLWIFHIESGTLGKFVINRAKYVEPLFIKNSFFHLKNKGWLTIAHDAEVYIADIDHLTNNVSWKYLTEVPYKQCGPMEYYPEISSVLAIKEKFFCSFENCNNVAIYDGRNNVWTMTHVEPNCSSSLFVSQFKLESSKLVCFSDEPVFVSKDGNIFMLHNALKDEFHHLPICCLPVQESTKYRIFQHVVKGMIVIIGYGDYGDIKMLDVFYNDVQSLQDLAFKTLSIYYYFYSSFKFNNEAFKSMLNLPCSLNRKYF